MNSANILGIFLFKQEARIIDLIRTIKTMAPHMHDLIIYQDLTNKSYDLYPTIVKQHRQLPIFIVKGLKEPLIGVVSIQKWLAVQITRSDHGNESNRQNGSTTSQKEEPLIFQSDGLDGYQPGEMTYGSSNYAYLSEKMNMDMNCNFARVSGIKGHMTEVTKDTGYKETKSGKQSEIDKRYQDMMSERKKLLEAQNSGNTINL